MPTSPGESRLVRASRSDKTKDRIKQQSSPLPSPKITSSDAGNMTLVVPRQDPKYNQRIVSSTKSSKNLPKYTLEEQKYASDLQKIISRDYYNEGLPVQSDVTDAPDMALDVYQANFTSEDNRSYSLLVDKEKRRKMDSTPWLFNGRNQVDGPATVKTRELLKGVSVEDQDMNRLGHVDNRPAVLESWAPPSSGTTDISQNVANVGYGKSKSIVKANTRLPSQHQFPDANLTLPQRQAQAKLRTNSKKDFSHDFVLSPATNSGRSIRKSDPLRPVLSPAGTRMIQSIIRRKPSPSASKK